jgi:hypothetical protein
VSILSIRKLVESRLNEALGVPVDETALGINEKLAKKYNTLVKFINNKTIYEDGAINTRIVKLEYYRDKISGKFTTKDTILITVEKPLSEGTTVVHVTNPNALKLDRKYNMVTVVDDLTL